MRDRVKAALQDALRSKDPVRLATLRLIQAAIKDRDIAARAVDESVDSRDHAQADETQILQLLAKMIRQRDESASVYEEAGRLELADRERAEIAVIEEFLPQPLSAEEVDAAIAETVTDVGARDIRDMGRVMQALKAAYPGRMDFGRVSALVKTTLTAKT